MALILFIGVITQVNYFACWIGDILGISAGAVTKIYCVTVFVTMAVNFPGH